MNYDFRCMMKLSIYCTAFNLRTPDLFTRRGPPCVSCARSCELRRYFGWMGCRSVSPSRLQAKRTGAGYSRRRMVLRCSGPRKGGRRRNGAQNGASTMRLPSFNRGLEDTKVAACRLGDAARAHGRRESSPAGTRRNNAGSRWTRERCRVCLAPNLRPARGQRLEPIVPIYYWGPPADDFVMKADIRV